MKSFYSLLLLCGLGLTAHAQIDSVAHHLKEVVVLGHDARTDNLLTPQTGGVVIKGAAIANMPVMLGEPDVLKALQTQTGVSSGIEGFTGIYVRGGENDQNLYMLHRLPLYNVNHLGGLFSSFNVAMVENVKFFKAGFPAEYGGRVASVTDIQLKRSDFEEYHGQASIGLLSGNVHITGPIIEDRLAFSASVRRSWMELVTIPTLAIINNSKKKNGEKIIGKYSFTDINLKLDYNISDYLDGFTHFYLGRDRTKIGAVDYISQVGTLDYSADPAFRLTSERINKTFASLKLEGQNGMPFTNEAMQKGDCCIRITEKGDYTYYMGENARLRKVTLFSISEAYYKYLISVLSNDSESSWQGGLTDIGLSEPVRIFSNINGGCGILGCLHSDKKIVKLPNIRE